MASYQSQQDAGHTTRNRLSIPQFEPLPPTSWINRIINKVLAPLYYLLFTIITAIIVVPVYTVIENFKHGRSSKGGERVPHHEDPGRPQGKNKVKEFLQGYSSSYGGKGKGEAVAR